MRVAPTKPDLPSEESSPPESSGSEYKSEEAESDDSSDGDRRRVPFNGCIGLCSSSDSCSDCEDIPIAKRRHVQRKPVKQKKKAKKKVKNGTVSAKKRQQIAKKTKFQQRIDEQKDEWEVLHEEDFLSDDDSQRETLKSEVFKSADVPEYFRWQNLPDNIENNNTALDLMFLFMPIKMWYGIVTETNRHFVNNKPDGQNGQRWKPVKLEELLTWHALLLAMTLQKNPSNYSKYWETETPDTFANEAVRPTDYGRFMKSKQYRWEEIKRFMHFNDSAKDESRQHPDHDPLFKLRPIIKVLDRTFQRYGELGVNCAIDEGMVAGRLRTHLRRTVPNKPDPEGFRLWCRSDSITGYYHTILVNTGDEVSRYREAFQISSSVPLAEG